MASLGSMASDSNSSLRTRAVDFLDGQSSPSTAGDNAFDPTKPVLNDFVQQRTTIRNKIQNNEYTEEELVDANKLLARINQKIASMSKQ
jgi:hypothetical protein